MKKIFVITLSVMMVVSLFAGCGGAPATPAPSTAAEAPAATTPAAEAPAADAPAEKQDLSISLWDYSITEYNKTHIESFNEMFPQYNIKIVESTAAEYEDKIQIMLSGGDTTDVVYMKGAPSLSALIVKNQVLALDDYIANANIDPAMYSGLIEHMKLNGKTYGMPYRKDNYLLFYNKRIFDNAGVAYPKDGMTLEEWRETAKAVTSGEGSDKIYGGHYHTWGSQGFILPRRVGEFDPIRGDVVAQLKPYYDVMIAMQNDDKSIMDYASLKAGSIHYSGVFYNEQIAMINMGTWFINNLVEKTADGTIDFEWGAVATPNVKGIGNTMGTGGVTPLCINAKAQNPDGAWDFINYVCGKEGAEILSKTGILPGYTDDTVITNIVSQVSVPQDIGQYLTVNPITIDTEMHEKGREIDKIIGEQHDLIMTNGTSVDDGLKELQERLNEIL